MNSNGCQSCALTLYIYVYTTSEYKPQASGLGRRTISNIYSLQNKLDTYPGVPRGAQQGHDSTRICAKYLCTVSNCGHRLSGKDYEISVTGSMPLCNHDRV